ncbi:hypothetical protein ACOKM5_07700 [Streptomyces sp. BH097]|uniref:hypothetical protein n=1 Tax=unclassified Streptomyces TaxID=2593676 RepID=UPI003BB5ECC6
MGDTTGAALATAGAPMWLAKHLEDAARVAAHYVVGHSMAASYRLHVTVDRYTITVAVTDYDDQPMTKTPAWLPVNHDNTLQPARPEPDADPLTPHPEASDGLSLHRTPDGHMCLSVQAPWPQPTGR